MSEFTREQLFEIYDSLSPYEVAVLAMTSPVGYELQAGEVTPITITTKETYLWAGAIAHVLLRNAEYSPESVVSMALEAISYEVASSEMYESLVAPSFTSYGHLNINHVVSNFLNRAGVHDKDEVFRRTEDAVRSLIWRGYIEDPFSKKVGTAIVSVVLTMPVGYTSTGPNDCHINSLTWDYVQHQVQGREQREIRVKVKEAADALLNKIVPAVVGAIGKLADSSDVHPMSTNDIQKRLTDLHYYHGQIDGKSGAQTVAALRRFQLEHYLPVSGYPDQETVKILKSR